MVGLQYYLPPEGRRWLAANYSHMSSGNVAQLAAPGSVKSRRIIASSFRRGSSFDRDAGES